MGRSTVGPAVPAGSTVTPWFATSRTFWPERVSASPWPLKMRSPVSPLSATWMLPAVSRDAVVRRVGVEIVVLPARAAVWKLASPDWTARAVRCCRETGFCELSTIVIRRVRPHADLHPVGEEDLGGGAGAGAHEVVLLEHHREGRGFPLEGARRLDVHAAVERGEADATSRHSWRAMAEAAPWDRSTSQPSAPATTSAPPTSARVR